MFRKSAKPTLRSTVRRRRTRTYLEYFVADLDAPCLERCTVWIQTAHENGHTVAVLVAGQTQTQALIAALQLHHEDGVA